MARRRGRFARFLVSLLAFVGAVCLGLSAWLASGRSTGLERLVHEADPPRPADVIVCLGGGLAGNSLPTQEGLTRVYTAVQLLADGLAPRIIFSGGGTEKVSEAEVYSEVAQWLGCPPEAILRDPIPGSTAEHPANLLKLGPDVVSRDTPILLVTSWYHSKRAAMCFRKAGFSNVRVVPSYEAERSPLARSRLRSMEPAYSPAAKDYGDPLNSLRWRLDDLLLTLREMAAIGVYWWRGAV